MTFGQTLKQLLTPERHKSAHRQTRSAMTTIYISRWVEGYQATIAKEQ